MRLSILGTAGLLLVAGTALAQEADPLGDQFQVNTYTTDSQDKPIVAADADGNFVVVWESRGSSGTDTSSTSVQAQRYDASGTTAGGEFQVNLYTTSTQETPDVAMDAQGNFVVVWSSDGSSGTDTDGYGIQAQRYDASGTLAGGEFQVNSYTTGEQYGSGIALDSQGNFVVVWHSRGSYGTDTSSWSVQAQRYDAGGTAVGTQFQVNSYTTGWQNDPAVALDSEGDFVVVWTSDGSSGTDTNYASVQAQRYDASGTPVGGQFQVNSYTTLYQFDPAVALDSEGNFVVVWTSDGSSGTDTSFASVQAQRYDASGTPVGGEFQVNSYTITNQENPGIAFDAQGNFEVVWQSRGSYGTDTSMGSIQGQRYDASGTAVGGQFQVNSYTTAYQFDPAVALDPQGNFVVVWSSDGSSGTDTSSTSVQAQRFTNPTIYADGFESGDTSAWSSTVQ